MAIMASFLTVHLSHNHIAFPAFLHLLWDCFRFKNENKRPYSFKIISKIVDKYHKCLVNIELATIKIMCTKTIKTYLLQQKVLCVAASNITKRLFKLQTFTCGLFSQNISLEYNRHSARARSHTHKIKFYIN